MKPSISTVFVTYEAVPFAKVGGLADVAGALPQALSSIGCDTVVIMPRFGDIDIAGFELEEVAIPEDWYVGIDYKHHTFQAWQTELSSGTRIYFLGDEEFYGRSGIYNDGDGNPFNDELERYVFFAKGAVELIKCLGIRPDVIHINDYQTALVAAYVRETYAEEDTLKQAALVYSIHNLAYQGVYGAERLPTMGFDADRCHPYEPFECYGMVNLMKIGIHFADEVNTVSPTYAREILSAECGAGLEDVLGFHKDKVRGIVNGIDEDVWDPATDPLIPYHFTKDKLSGKRGNKGALLKVAGISLDRLDAPLIGMVGRLVAQKGLDIVAPVFDDLISMGATFIVLGSGAKEFEDFLTRKAKENPETVAVSIGFDNELAHRITAASDFFLMPSRYEPCGLNQMYAMRYGTIPIVRRTGGLADTVEEWKAHNGAGTGFSFSGLEPADLAAAVFRAIQAWKDEKQREHLIQNAMTQDFSWKRSALCYRAMYEDALAKRRAADLP